MAYRETAYRVNTRNALRASSIGANPDGTAARLIRYLQRIGYREIETTRRYRVFGKSHLIDKMYVGHCELRRGRTVQTSQKYFPESTAKLIRWLEIQEDIYRLTRSGSTAKKEQELR